MWQNLAIEWQTSAIVWQYLATNADVGSPGDSKPTRPL